MEENKDVTAVQKGRFGFIEQFFRKDLHSPKGVDMRLHGALKWSVIIVTVLATIALVQPRTARAADVTACAQRSTGDLRLVNSANECRVGETPLTLSTRGDASTSGSGLESGNHSITSCVNSETVTVTLPVVLTKPSILLAFGTSNLLRPAANGTEFRFNVRTILVSGSTSIAERTGAATSILPGHASGSGDVSGPMLSFQTHDIFTVTPGSYTLQLVVSVFSPGECNIQLFTGNSLLSFVTQPAG